MLKRSCLPRPRRPECGGGIKITWPLAPVRHRQSECSTGRPSLGTELPGLGKVTTVDRPIITVARLVPTEHRDSIIIQYVLEYLISRCAS